MPRYANGNTGDQTPSIGKPFHEHRNGNDVGESNPDSSDNSIT
jgi:hypothetical protein